MNASARPLRVALLSPSFGGYGGMEAFALAIAAGLPPTAELEVRVGFKRTRGFALQPELRTAAESLGARVSYIARGSLALGRMVRWADVVHSFNPSPDTVLAARLLHRPLLLNVINHRQPGTTLRQRLWSFCLRRGDRRLYISDFVRRTWEGAAVWPDSAVVFPICTLADQPSPPAARRGFVFVARWIANKGLDTLVEAYARAALDPVAWPLRLLGDGPLRPAIERRLAALGLHGVSTPGFLSPADKADAIRSARWMVVPPNTREDFGLTALEARHLGVPCIITRDGGLPEAAGDEALACAPGDVAGLAACLRAAAAMPEDDYARRAARTRDTLLPRLARPAFYATAYRQLAAGGPTP